VELAAVVVVPAMKNAAARHEPRPHASAPSGISRRLYSSLTPILGNDVLRAWMERVRKLGVQSLWLTSRPHDESDTYSALARFARPDFAGHDLAKPDFARPDFAREGIERLLMIKLKSYAEMDLADLLLFHCQSRNSVTEVHDSRGELGVWMLDQLALPAGGEKPESHDSRCTPYSFRGYAKRILSARGRQELVGDGLTGACAMRPLGREICEQVWVGEDVSLAESARVVGPSYIGDRTIVHAGATIGPFASVERDCVVDCGTTVERSTVLPRTYLAPGLLIRHALVDGSYLENLSCGTVANLQPGGLASRMRRTDSRAQTFSEPADDVFSRTGSCAWSADPYPGDPSSGDPSSGDPCSAEWREVRL
jgi:carbonic anhydrase/acetyltransferase-like protein (isoleucine patch superfamily)